MEVKCKIEEKSRAAIVQLILRILLAKAPKQFKNDFQYAFALFTSVLRRQQLLTLTRFKVVVVDNKIEAAAFSNEIHEICNVCNLKRTEIDIDRVVWVSKTTLDKFLIRPGQWVTLRNKSSLNNHDQFTCQVLPFQSETEKDLSSTTIQLNSASEYNLRKALGIPIFMFIPDLQLKPLITDPVIKTRDKSLPFFAPIQAKTVILTRVKNLAKETPLKECEMLIQDAFEPSSKYLCLGDIVSISNGVGINCSYVDLIVTEINGKCLDDDDSCRELFIVSKDSTRLSIGSNELSDNFNLAVSESQAAKLLAPCLHQHFRRLCGWMRQALLSSYLNNCSGSERQSFGLNPNTDLFNKDLWPNILLHGPVGSGKTSLCQTVALRLGLNFYFINGTNFIGDTTAYSEAKLRAVHDKITQSLCPALVFIKNIHLLGKDKEGHEDKRAMIAFEEFLHDLANVSLECGNQQGVRNAMSSRAIFIVGSTDTPEALVPSISQNFLLKLELPSAISSLTETESTLRWLLQKGGVINFGNIDLGGWVKENCGGMQRSLGDVKALAANAVRNAAVRSQTVTSVEDDNLSLVISSDDLNASLKTVDAILKKAASAVEVPKVGWEDIGGLEEIKKELINSVRLPLEYPHLFSSGIRRSGILLYGPPGTGKTLIAKAVATEFKLSFLSVKGPELLNMYVGQSEQNVRDVFTRARNAAPCIIFFDELDALAPNRGRAGDSGGVMDRVVSQILAELDGTHSTPDVFIIGATNRPDLIDPALLRPGRFDKLLYVGINQDVESKASVLKALTRKFHLAEDVDLSQVASLLPKGMSGADLYSLCSDTYMTAVERLISVASRSQSDQGESFKDDNEECNVMIQLCDFEAAINRSSPSLSDADQYKYEALKALKR